MTKRILNPLAKPEDKLHITKVVVMYSAPGTDVSMGLHHQWLDIDLTVKPGDTTLLPIPFEQLVAHK
ncbi:hypothetical protein UFOVP249_2 [uncultured Caudovirales phage]|uniref:Uncharacterized protein n=1 Tax=uncultured Caudovirales phage TaxID=2100421 RepID=A0A6J5LID7_9CAUD|nr:hypothetical protein UFOVP249_2 [uncultured Caudovirales phage]